MKINMAHGGGGSIMAGLIDNVFKKHFSNDLLLRGEDSAVLDLSGKTAFTTDSFVVQPLFFPGGDIGRLAVCGTVNDLLTVGAVPRYLSTAFVIEEGMELEALERVVVSLAETAREAGVQIVTGDTKVVEGHGGLILNTTGIGSIPKEYAPLPPQPGDGILITGTLGEHHAAILSRRMGIENDIRSDCAPLVEIVRNLQSGGVHIRAMRDITRGGLATILCELSALHCCGMEVDETALPVTAEIKGFCGILGLDPMYMGNEGKLAVIVDGADMEKALEIIQNSRYGSGVATVGRVTAESGTVMRTALGGSRAIRPLAGEGLPRIC